MPSSLYEDSMNLMQIGQKWDKKETLHFTLTHRLQHKKNLSNIKPVKSSNNDTPMTKLDFTLELKGG